ncbi:transcription factor grauzone [Zeugodacus cucurbitae]|uniref:transcription factor grauzone n=1 Tax=Zeugodacus cucurbitae TaxID=28588 RepID=UPI0005968FF8|nr:transcription factor grauzone [Zeugodacus cucurbitae]
MSSHYCSLCIYQTKLLIPLRAEGSDVSTSILHTVHKYIGIMLTSNDVICVNCWTSVDDFRKFCLMIAERQAKYVPQAVKELEQDCDEATNNRNIAIARKAVGLQTVENIESIKASSDAEERVFKEQSTITAVMPAFVDQDNNTPNEQDTHFEIIKIEQTDTTEQQVIAQINTDLNTESEQDTSTSSDAETTVTEMSVRRSVHLRRDDMQQQMLTQETTDLNTEAKRNKTASPEADTKSLLAEDELIALHMQLTCDICTFKTKSFEVLKAHFKQLHNCNGYVVCCEKRLYKRGLLLDHIHVHRNPAYFSCTDCATNFADRLCLLNHMRMQHQQAIELLHECAICSARFAKARYLRQHALTHTNGAEQQQCALCAKSFANTTRLRAHMKRLHNKSKLFSCQHCGCEVSGKWCFVRHLAQHGAQLETSSAKERLQRVQCTVCNQWLAHKSTLISHMKRHAVADSVYACQLCEQQFGSLVALQAHKRLSHGIERQQHACNVCARKYKTTRRLREHMTTHTGNQLYSCNYCDKHFKYSSTLYAHRKRKHPTEWAQDKSSKQTENHP